jgi:hypothetical protein
MSVTIERQPDDCQPVFNQLRWIVESNNIAQPNFEYICDVYVNGGSTYIARLKRFPDADGYGDFDISRVLADYVSVTLAESDDNGFNLHRSHYVNYVLKFGEIYNGTTYTNLTVTSIQTGLMMALSFNQFQNYDYLDYIIDFTNVGKFLTNSRYIPANRFFAPDGLSLRHVALSPIFNSSPKVSIQAQDVEMALKYFALFKRLNCFIKQFLCDRPIQCLFNSCGHSDWISYRDKVPIFTIHQHFTRASRTIC